MEQGDRIKESLDVVLDVFCGRHPRGFKALAERARPDFWFKDPFVEIHGFENFKNFLREAASHRVDTQWIVANRALAIQSGYVRWRYVATYQNGCTLDFDGMTEFGFDGEGGLAFQIDFWDSAEALAVMAPALRDPIAVAKKSIHV